MTREELKDAIRSAGLEIRRCILSPDDVPILANGGFVEIVYLPGCEGYSAVSGLMADLADDAKMLKRIQSCVEVIKKNAPTST